MLAVVYCVKKWRCYIEGRDVNVFTDHKPNTFIDTIAIVSVSRPIGCAAVQPGAENSMRAN